MPLFLLRLFTRLPLRALHGMGHVLGWLVYLLPGRFRRRLRANAAQAGYADPAFARRAAGEIGAMILEAPKVWLHGSQCLPLAISAEDSVVRAALDEGRGILFLTPHLGCFEIAGRYLAQLLPMTVMFRPPRHEALAPLMADGRNAPGLTAVPATLLGVRAFVRALRRGEAVGMLPDQVPSQGEGVWAPFFGRMAYTVTLPGRLATQTGVAVIMTIGERLPRGRGWRIHHVRIPDPLPDSAQEQAALINQAMETMIRRFPEQYLWSYNHYKTPRGTTPPPPMPASTAATAPPA